MSVGQWPCLFHITSFERVEIYINYCAKSRVTQLTCYLVNFTTFCLSSKDQVFFLFFSNMKKYVLLKSGKICLFFNINEM